MVKLKHTKKQIRKYGTFDEMNLVRQNKKDITLKIRELIKKDKLILAEYTINNYIEKYEIDCYILHEQARYNAAINEIDKAKEIYKKIIEDDSENKYYSIYELAKLESEDGNYLQAISYLEQIIASNHKEKCHAILEIAKNLNYLGENKKALEYLNIIINNNMENKFLAMECMAMVLIDECKFKKANEYIENVKNKIDNACYKYLKGSLELKKDNYFNAKMYFEDIIKNETVFRKKATCALGNVEFELENYERAIEVFETITPNDRNYYIEAIKKIASCYMNLKNLDKAEEYINLLNTEDNKYINDQYFLYGKLLKVKKDYNGALSYFNKVDVNENNLYLDSLYNIVCISIKIEQYENAFKLLKQLEQIDKNNRYAERTNTMKLFVSKKLGLNEDIKIVRYTDNLIVNYDKDLVLEHIEKHKYEKESNDKHTIFSSDIDINELYNHVINNLKDEYFYYNDFVDIYLIPYKEVGIKNGEDINYVKVVTLPNSNKIITIYPYYCFLNEKTNKQKKMSRINKFNLKYGINT